MNRQLLVTKILSGCIAMSLAFAPAAYAEILVPPISSSVNGESSSGAKGPGAGQTNESTGTSNTNSTNNTGSTNDTAGPDPAGTTNNEKIEKPVVQAEGAVLIDGATGKVLYGKNENTQYYPASITKIMTALLVLENTSLSDKVTFSAAATTNLESGSVSLGISEGDTLTIEQSLYGFILKSANEIGNGLAEHVSGSSEAFVAKMNERAKQLGCQNTNFANPHGLNHSEHKTTPYDMALIAREAFKNQDFRKIDSTLTYEFPATKKAAARTITMGHKMMYPSDARYYEGIIGGKTGYTSKAGNTLVTGVERNGVQLIVVIMKSNSTHYTDTKALLDYGFANYDVLTGTSSQTDSVPQPESAPAGPGETSQSGSGKWHQDADGWYYIKADGRKAKDEWLTDAGNDYWFDANEYMATGWRQFNNGTWYYFRGSGAMAKNYWVETEGTWFYLGENGVMLTNTQTPDGHWVNEVGIWEQR